MAQKSESIKRLFVSTPKEYISNLPRYQFAGRIFVLQSPQEAERAVRALSRERVLGFDTETRPRFKKGPMRPPALLQIATEDTCFLFRIFRIGVTPALSNLLCNPEIIKVGISLKDDAAALLRSHTHFSTDSWVDLQRVAKQLGLQDQGLARLFANVFKRRISKGQQRSNWEADVLTPAQKLYAATDADACLKLFDALQPLLNGSPYELEDFPTETIS